MRTLRTVQTSFTAGELDARLDARIEVTRYYAGASRLMNAVVIPQGGAKRRPGTRHLADLPIDALGGLRLIPFAFSAAQTFLVVLFDGAFRVYRGADGVQVFAGTWPGGAEIAAQVNWAQSADTLLLFHPDLPPHRIQRGAFDDVWTSAPLTLTNIPTFDFGTGAEPVISVDRGWPECGTFHQGRLWLGGLRSRPTTLLASVAGAVFDFAVGSNDADAMMVSIDGDQLNAIHQLLSHRGLLVFTSGGEHAVTVAPPITPTNVALEEQTRRGIRRFTRLDEVDGAVMFVQRGGAALRQFVYDELQQSWQAEIASLLAPHLIRDPRDVVIRRSTVQDDADLVFLPDSDGAGLTVLTTLRAQEIAGFSRWHIDGVLRGVAGLANGNVFLAVERDGLVRVLLLDADGLLDHASRQVFGAPVTSLSGLDHLAGREVVMMLDRRPEGTATVAGDGTLALPRACLDAEIGIGFPVEIHTMPIEPRDPAGALIGRTSRFVKITARVHRSGAFDIRSQVLNTRTLGGPPAPPLDVVPPPPPVWPSADLTLEGIVGWHPKHIIEISQPADRPQPLTLQALAVTVAVGG
jgi:hypothetical protein